MKITIGITSYNRLKILRLMAKSLYASILPIPYNIRIYDDASTDYDEHLLRQIFPDAKIIYRHTCNQGSDANIAYMYQDFLTYTDDLFFNADSDLIFSPHWLVKSLEILPETDGILSVFNTERYGGTSVSDSLITKEVLGSAGTFFTREIVDDFMQALKENTNHSFDWKWSHYLRKQGKRLCATKKSLVQHIGLSGYNSSSSNFAFGTGFQVDSIENGQALNDVIEIMAKQKIVNENRNYYAIFPFGQVPNGSRIVIYGAGIAGQDYVQQIQETRYCKIVSVVDKNYSAHPGVKSPESLRNLDFDYIVLAAVHDVILDSMKRDIELIIGNIQDKIIYPQGDKIIRINAC